MPRLTSSRLLRQGLMLLIAAAASIIPGYAQQCLVFRDCPGLVADWDRSIVDLFLAAHQLPSTDRDLIATFAREDLRNDLRAFALGELIALTQLSDSQRNAMQNAVISHVKNNIQNLEIASAQAAVDHKNELVGNLCGWKPDAMLAKAFAYSYDGTFFCGDRNSLFLGVFPPSFPKKEYFQAYGQKKTYFDPLSNYVNGVSSYREISANSKLILIFGTIGGAGIGLAIALTGLNFLTKFFKLLQPFQIAREIGNSTPIGFGITIALLLITITVVVFVFYEGQAQLAALGALDTDLAAIRASRVDLGLMAKDPKGVLRFATAYSMMSLSPVGTPQPAPAPLPSRLSHDPVFVIKDPVTNTETVSDKLVYRNWSNSTSEAQMYGGWFLQKIGFQGTTYDSFGLKLRYFANNTFYTLDRSANVLLVSKEQPVSTDIECPTGSDGYTNYSPLSQCRSFIARSVVMETPAGLREVSVAQQPAFLTPAEAAFTIGGGTRTFSIRATGLPLPSIQTSSALPPGVTFESSAVAGPGRATLRYDGTSGSAGTFDISLTATHGGGSATQPFKLLIATAVKIAPPSPPDVTYGSMSSFPVQIAGFPRPTLSVRGSGLTGNPFCNLRPSWADDGTAKLEGLAILSDITGRNICEGFLMANNGVSSDEIYISFKGKTPPQPVLTINAFDFNVGVPNSFTLRTAPASEALVHIRYPLLSQIPGYPNAPPNWLTLTDLGNGTATLSGTPPADAPERFNVELEVFTEGALAGYSERNLLRIHVVKYPVITSAAYGIFNTIATADYFGMLTKPGTVSVEPNAQNEGLPAGFAIWTPGDTTFRIYGRGNVGGETTFYLTSRNSLTAEVDTIPFRAIIAEPPKLSMPFGINFYIGQSKSLPILASGYPVRPIEGIAGAPGPMDISYRGILPPGLQFVTTDPDLGPTYGKAVISGVATTPGSTMLVIFANNGVGSAASQSLFLNVTIPGDVNFDGRVDCNDAKFITAKYGQRRGTSGYDWNADYNLDGYIDVRDLAQVSARLPAGTRCQ